MQVLKWYPLRLSNLRPLAVSRSLISLAEELNESGYLLVVRQSFSKCRLCEFALTRPD